MDIKKSLSFGIIVSYVGRFTQIASNIIFLPLLFRKLGTDEVGFWLLIGQAGIFVGLLDFGFTATLTRRVSFATQKAAEGVVSEDKTFDFSLETVIYTGRKLYVFLAVLVFIVSILSGLWFLSTVPDTKALKTEVYTAWVLLCFGYATNTWAGSWSCILAGMGKVSQQGIITTGFQLFGWILKIAVVIFGGGIVGLAATEVVVGLASRIVFVIYIKRSNPELLKKGNLFSMALITSMAKPALIAWVTSLAAYVIYRTDQYFILARLGIKSIPNYQAAATVIDNLLNMAMIVGLTATPFYSIFWRQQEVSKFKSLLYSNAKTSLAISLIGGGCVLVLSPQLFDLWLGKGHFVGFAILSVFVIRTSIQSIHWNLAQAIRSTEHETFMIPAIAAAILNLVLTYYLSLIYGLLGIAIGTAIAELTTTCWSAFYYAKRRLNISVGDYWRNVGIPTGGLILVTGTIFFMALIPDYSQQLRLPIQIIGALSMGAILTWYLWRYALPDNYRDALKKSMIKLPLIKKYS